VFDFVQFFISCLFVFLCFLPTVSSPAVTFEGTFPGRGLNNIVKGPIHSCLFVFIHSCLLFFIHHSFMFVFYLANIFSLEFEQVELLTKNQRKIPTFSMKKYEQSMDYHLDVLIFVYVYFTYSFMFVCLHIHSCLFCFTYSFMLVLHIHSFMCLFLFTFNLKYFGSS